MKVKKINEYSKSPKESISNQYPTKKHSFKEPGIKLIIGTRGTGKSYTAAKIMLEAKKDKIFDVTYFITPTFDSNKAHWSQFNISEENVYYPSRDSIAAVIKRIEQDRDDFENFLIEMEIYERFKRETKNKDSIARMEAENLNEYINLGYVGENGYINNKLLKPEWKYKDISGKIRPPTSLLVMDDVLGSTALSQSEAFTKLCIMNRHIAPLSEAFDNRQALGCSVMILSQCYSARQGIPRSLRENATDLILFKNRQQDAMKKLKDELAGAIDEEEFEQAYLYATDGKHDNLTITFNPDCPTKRFRKNLNEFIIFPEAEKECRCGSKMGK